MDIKLSYDKAGNHIRSEQAVEKLGGLTTLVNNAGVLQGGAFGVDEGGASLANFDYNFNANTRAPFEMM